MAPSTDVGYGAALERLVVFVVASASRSAVPPLPDNLVPLLFTESIRSSTRRVLIDSDMGDGEHPNLPSMARLRATPFHGHQRER